MQYTCSVIRPNQKIQLTILELGGDGKWYEMHVYCKAMLLNLPDSVLTIIAYWMLPVMKYHFHLRQLGLALATNMKWSWLK
uniref:Uncharacterized protein n=1 Tax=Romanomermis culicivorax TaxID=13658 RepID=A0A915IZ46_ROMCU